jgi:hypothetical protein
MHNEWIVLINNTLHWSGGVKNINYSIITNIGFTVINARNIGGTMHFLQHIYQKL